MTQQVDTSADDPQMVPVELDQPSPAVAHWAAISSAEVVVDHDGDASKVIPFPRPAWSEPWEDEIGRALSSTYYNSESTDVVASMHRGENPTKADGSAWWNPASVRVRARLAGDGQAYVGIRLRRVIDSEWAESGMSLTPDEALELSDVIRAACALHREP